MGPKRNSWRRGSQGNVPHPPPDTFVQAVPNHQQNWATNMFGGFGNLGGAFGGLGNLGGAFGQLNNRPGIPTQGNNLPTAAVQVKKQPNIPAPLNLAPRIPTAQLDPFRQAFQQANWDHTQFHTQVNTQNTFHNTTTINNEPPVSTTSKFVANYSSKVVDGEEVSRNKGSTFVKKHEWGDGKVQYEVMEDLPPDDHTISGTVGPTDELPANRRIRYFQTQVLNGGHQNLDNLLHSDSESGSDDGGDPDVEVFRRLERSVRGTKRRSSSRSVRGVVIEPAQPEARAKKQRLFSEPVEYVIGESQPIQYVVEESKPDEYEVEESSGPGRYNLRTRSKTQRLFHTKSHRSFHFP